MAKAAKLKVVPAVKPKVGASLGAAMEQAMSQAIADSYAKGITDPEKQRAAMKAARTKAKADFVATEAKRGR